MKNRKKSSERIQEFINEAVVAAQANQESRPSGRDEQVLARARARVLELLDQFVAVQRYEPTSPMPTVYGLPISYKAWETLRRDLMKAVNDYATYAAEGVLPDLTPDEAIEFLGRRPSPEEAESLWNSREDAVEMYGEGAASFFAPSA